MLPSKEVDLLAYIDGAGRKPFEDWFSMLDNIAAAKVTIALTRISQGRLSNVKGVGGGVQEYKIDWGPGYRIYFAREGGRLVILLGGGIKKRQQKDIQTAQARWADYKKRKARHRAEGIQHGADS